jgi:hypothetical protein
MPRRFAETIRAPVPLTAAIISRLELNPIKRSWDLKGEGEFPTEQFVMTMKRPELLDEPTRRLMATLAQNTPKWTPKLAEPRARVTRRRAVGTRNVSQRDATLLSAQDCLDSATYCDDMASHVQDYDVKLSFAESARSWRILAQQIERPEKEQKS